MGRLLVKRLTGVSRWLLWLMSVALALVITELTVAVVQWSQIGVVTSDYLVTGMVASLVAASVVTGIILYFLDHAVHLGQENELLSAIIATCPIPMMVNDEAQQVIMLNPEFVRVFGYTQGDIPNLEAWWLNAYPDPQYRQWAMKTRCQRMATASGTFDPLEVKIRCKNGVTRTAMASATHMSIGGGSAQMVVLQDVTERAATMEALAQSHTLLQSIVENIPVRVFWKDRSSRYLGCNTPFAIDGGEISPEEIIGKMDDQLTWRDQAAAYQRDDRDVMETAVAKLGFEEPQTTPDGRQIWLRTSKVPLQDGKGAVVGMLGVYEDITRYRAEQDYIRIAATAFETQEGMVIVAAGGNILRVNQAFCRITGFAAAEAVGKTLSILKSGVHDQSFYEEMWACIGRDGSWAGEIFNRRKSGEIYPQWLNITAVKDDAGTVTHYIGTMMDITDRKAVESKVQHLAHHDALTDLPNRMLLTDRLHQAIAQARRDKAAVALLYLDLDRFKPVNDNLGHDVGDALLKLVASRLSACVARESDTVSRVGGDEFVVLLAQLENESEVTIVASKILNALGQPFVVDGHVLDISCSVGIALFPAHGTDGTVLMKNADSAMYEAKTAGRSCFRIYTPPLATSVPL